MAAMAAMFPYQSQNIYHQPQIPQTSSGNHLRISGSDVNLSLRQQPKEAQVTVDGKEKVRKPVDPPPIVQLHVKPDVDPAQHFLQSPYLFMCVSLFKADKDEAWNGNKSLTGSLVSSLHRLKDVDNKDGGFFVFGDISVKVQGTFRLHFSLFDLQKDTGEVAYLGSITSEPFKVLLPKDYRGMEESTYLSRAFSDQGVRLRLRKEPRAMGNKRPYPYSSDATIQNAPIRPNVSEYSSYGLYGDATTSSKRMRVEEERKDSLPDNSTVSGAGLPLPQSTSYTMGTYASFDNAFTPMTPMAPMAPHTSRYSDFQYSHVGQNTSYWR